MPGVELIVGFANATAPSNMNRTDLRTMEIIASLQQTQVRLTSISPLPHKQIVMGFAILTQRRASARVHVCVYQRLVTINPMLSTNCLLILALAAILLASSSAVGQVPTGSISGTVSDESGATIPGAQVTITNLATGMVRRITTGNDGGFSASSLNIGTYDVKVEASGFKALVSQTVVTAGGISSLTLKMQLGESKEVVTVEGIAPQINYESQAIAGIVSRQQIESLPLNGRSFLQLALLEPGVTVTTASTSQYNHQFNVSVMGGDPAQTRITVDGVNIVDGIDGGTQQNFSQEVVQEFQIATTNFDLSTSVTGVGA